MTRHDPSPAPGRPVAAPRPPPAAIAAPLVAPAVPRLPLAPEAAPQIDPADFDLVRRLVRERSGIVIEPRQEYLVETRLKALARRRGEADPAALLARLRAGADPVALAEAVEALTTNETSFFRDTDPFEALKGSVLPELVGARASRRELRIWSAAASSGQELYSVAMLLREHFPQLAAWRLELLGTDLSAAMVRRAREGTYSSFEVRRGLPPPLAAKWLEPAGEESRVKAELRRLVGFREMNLVAPWPALPAFDVILLRNVLIYFDVETKRRLLARVRGALAQDGALLIGASESLLGVDESFKAVRIGRSTVYRP